MSPAEDWKPVYERWRHGGWYITNVSYPAGHVACTFEQDGKWYLVEDPTCTPFPSRDAAARSARVAAAMLCPDIDKY